MKHSLNQEIRNFLMLNDLNQIINESDYNLDLNNPIKFCKQCGAVMVYDSRLGKYIPFTPCYRIKRV